MHIARTALAVLARAGDQTEPGRWVSIRDMPNGVRLKICCSGPDLPDGVPAETMSPALIPHEPDWVGAYRLAIAAPLVAFDISWNPDQPLRIMNFSRGDWEDAL